MIEAKSPTAVLGVEGDDARIDSRCAFDLGFGYLESKLTSNLMYLLALDRMIKDSRVKEDKKRTIFDQDFSDRTGI